jgi:ATP-binding cassette subfamily C protein LapB
MSEFSNEDDVKSCDPLLEALVFLTAYYGQSKSAESLTAGLAYDGGHMKPSLFCEAAAKLGLKTSIVKRRKLAAIPLSVLPCVVILDHDQACVLLRNQGKKYSVFLPETGETKDIPVDDLQADYTGYCIYLHPQSAFSADQLNDDDGTIDHDKHWFWSLVRQSRKTYGLVIVASVFINLFALTSPLFIMNVYDRVIPNNAVETGWVLAIGALTIFVFDFILRTLRGYLIDVAGRRMDVVASRRIYDQVLNMKLAGRPKSSGAFANMLRDFDAVRDFFTSATITVVVDLPFTLFFIFVIYQLAGNIAFILLGIIAATIVVGLIIKIPLKAVVRKASKSSEAKHGMLVETIHAIETLKTSRADGVFRARYSDYVGENSRYGQQSRFLSAMAVNIATFLQQITSIIIVLFGMYLVQDGTLSMGGLIAGVILGGRALSPIGQIASLLTKYHQAGGALKTLDNIMAQPVERPDNKQFLHRADIEGGMSFKDVSFEYPGTQRKILNGVTFHIAPGEKVGIIGRIGSGKSTITRLIMGFYDHDDGSILIDDTDLRQIDPADLRRHVAYISQDIMLFTGSVRDNIAAGLPQASEARILEAAKASGVHDFISKHPQGYDAQVGEQGAFLSGGQKQAIALARAMITDPKVLVCDEPTNAMDSQAEAAFCSYIKEHAKDKTFIMVTHKPSVLHMVDRLLVVDQGRIVADGPRDQVLEALQNNQVEVPK